jgi:formate dehydrogenase subunit delta
MAHHMQREELVRMANQIAQFFEPYPENEAVDGVADHLKRFWSPAMRTQLLEYLNVEHTDLEPLVVQAAERLRA